MTEHDNNDEQAKQKRAVGRRAIAEGLKAEGRKAKDFIAEFMRDPGLMLRIEGRANKKDEGNQR